MFIYPVSSDAELREISLTQGLSRTIEWNERNKVSFNTHI